MLTPPLSLRDHGGVLTLVARVDAPNGCYFGASYAMGWPEGMAGVPETLPVQLKIGHTGAEVCSRGIVHLEYAVPLGDVGAGHNRVAAFAVQDTNILGATSNGWGFALQPAVPQGINPAHLSLDLEDPEHRASRRRRSHVAVARGRLNGPRGPGGHC